MKEKIKMKKDRINILAFFLFLLSALPLFPQDITRARVVDNANLLSAYEKSDLISRLDSLARTYNIDLVIVTENSIGDAAPMVYADDFFDYNNFGLGSSINRDGCLFLLVMGTRDYWISTSGRAIKILNPTAFGKLESDAVKFLRQNNYYAAFNSFLDNWELFLSLEARDRSYNFLEKWNTVVVIVVWLVALAIGFIVVQVWKSKMNTALQKTQADAYMVAGSLNFSATTDKFLYSVVTKTQRPQDNSSSGGGIHTSSSGGTHGGRGGKF